MKVTVFALKEAKEEGCCVSGNMRVVVGNLRTDVGKGETDEELLTFLSRPIVSLCADKYCP